MSDSSSQERAAQRSPAVTAAAQKDPLDGDWSEGLAGPPRPHGLPLPVALQVAPQAQWMAAPESNHAAPDSSEIALPVPEPVREPAGNGVIAGWTSPAEPLPDDAITEPLADPARAPVAGWDGAAANEPPPAPGGELTPEPPAPSWMEAPRPVLAPLAAGESLSSDDPELAPAPSAPPLLQVVPPQPEELDDPNLLVPVEIASAVPAPAPAPEGDMVVRGEQRVAVHTRAGRTRRGTVVHLDLSRSQFALQPQGGGSTETIAQSEVKAIFFMLAPGDPASLPAGQLVRITFEDSRTVEGYLSGGSDANGFFLVPTDAQKTNTRCIYVARGVVSNVAPI